MKALLGLRSSRRARSLSSLEKMRATKEMNPSQAMLNLNEEQIHATIEAADRLTEKNKWKILRRHEKIRDSCLSSRKEGPSHWKGKTTDPRDWGGRQS